MHLLRQLGVSYQPVSSSPTAKTLQKHLPLQFLWPSSNVRLHRCHLYFEVTVPARSCYHANKDDSEGCHYS